MCVVTFDWEENDAIEKFRNFDRTKSISWGVIDLTDYCNFNCKWCFANAGAVKQPLHMSLSDLKKVVNALSDAGLSQITYSGGEPTLYPYLKEAVSLAKNRGVVVHLNTNGYLLTKNMARELKEAGLSQVQINIDSIRSGKHDEARGKGGSFSHALMALKNAKDAGLTCTSQTVLTKENEDEILDIFRLARKLGIQRCRVWDMTPSRGYARDNRQLLPQDYLFALQKLSDFAYETGAKNVEAGDPLFRHYIKTKLSISGGYCVSRAGVIIYIPPNGDVYYCSTMRHKLYNIFGEIGKGSDIRRVHRQSVIQYANSERIPGSCQSCEHMRSCRGGCCTRRDFSGGMDYWCNKSGS